MSKKTLNSLFTIETKASISLDGILKGFLNKYLKHIKNIK